MTGRLTFGTSLQIFVFKPSEGVVYFLIFQNVFVLLQCLELAVKLAGHTGLATCKIC
jgi:hypothetical protein